MDLLIPSSPGGLPTLSLTTNSYWLSWWRVAMPLISPLMPVPLYMYINNYYPLYLIPTEIL